MQNQTHFFGYKRFDEFLNSAFGFSTPVIPFIISMIFLIIATVTGHLFHNLTSILIIVLLLATETLTGIGNAIIKNTFCSTRLPRMIIKLIVYAVLLGKAWHIAKFHHFFVWLPGTLYGGLCSVIALSAIKNICDINGWSYYEKISKKWGFSKNGSTDNKLVEISTESSQIKSAEFTGEETIDNLKEI